MAENLLDFILVLPPSRGQPSDDELIKKFDELHPYVTAFSLMTYDFSNAQRPGCLLYLKSNLSLMLILQYNFLRPKCTFRVDQKMRTEFGPGR